MKKMKSETTLIALARNLINKGYDEEGARYELARKYPEDEGTIFTMIIDENSPKFEAPVSYQGPVFVEQPVVENDAMLKDINDSMENLIEADQALAEQVDEVVEPVKPVKPVKAKKAKKVKVVEPVETVETVEAWVEQEAQADEASLIENILAQPVEVQTNLAAALIAALPETVINELMVKIKGSTVKPIFPPKTVKVPTGTTKTGRARILFLAAEDRSLKTLSDLFMQEIGWVRGDANYYAKLITAEFEAGKLK